MTGGVVLGHSSRVPMTARADGWLSGRSWSEGQGRLRCVPINFSASTAPRVPDPGSFRIWQQLGGDFDKYVRGRDLTKQEGLIFRHLLRMILLCGEFAQLAPPELDPADWQRELRELAEQLTATCRGVDPESTDKVLESMQQGADVVAGEAGVAVS